jgi:hypothetical protein
MATEFVLFDARDQRETDGKQSYLLCAVSFTDFSFHTEDGSEIYLRNVG